MPNTMLSIQPLALPGAKHVLKSSNRHQVGPRRRCESAHACPVLLPTVDISLRRAMITPAAACKHPMYRCCSLQRPGLAVLSVRARKQTEKQDVDADLVSDVLPADLQKLSKLAKVSPMSFYAAPTWYAAAWPAFLGGSCCAAVVLLSCTFGSSRACAWGCILAD